MVKTKVTPTRVYMAKSTCSGKLLANHLFRTVYYIRVRINIIYVYVRPLLFSFVDSPRYRNSIFNIIFLAIKPSEFKLNYSPTRRRRRRRAVVIYTLGHRMFNDDDATHDDARVQCVRVCVFAKTVFPGRPSCVCYVAQQTLTTEIENVVG